MTTIVSAVYGADGKSVAATTDDGWILWIPDDPRNWHRAELDKWVAEGNTITPYVLPDVPDEEMDPVSALQAALVAKGVVSDADVAEAASKLKNSVQTAKT